MLIESTHSTPKVVFGFEQKKLSISGICTPENPKLFFEPIFAAFSEYQKLHHELTIEINLDYFNTGSSKCILSLLQIISAEPEKKANTIVNWIVSDDDSELKESGEILAEITGLNFNYLSN